ETLIELAPRLEKSILQAIFDCKAGAGPPAEKPAGEPAVVEWDGTPRLVREIRAKTGRSSGYLYLHSDRFVWSRKRNAADEARGNIVITFDDVLRFEPTVSHWRGNQQRERRGGLFVRIADGRGMLYDPLGRPGDRSGDDYSPSAALQLAEEMNAYLTGYRRARRLDPETVEAADLSVRVRSEKRGTFRFDGEMIEFLPDKNRTGRYGFRLSVSRVIGIHINGWGEAAIRFDRDRPLGDGEHVDLEVRNGWIRLYGWEGKGLIREFERRGIEPDLGFGG
ncbi:MAG: hypothetical protein O7A63_07210, partial [Acidobacteria bacterium]|nr:hypothetical protein [Acidobacteriota bacterium]